MDPAKFLSPLGTSEFKRKYWDKKACLVRHSGHKLSLTWKQISKSLSDGGRWAFNGKFPVQIIESGTKKIHPEKIFVQNNPWHTALPDKQKILQYWKRGNGLVLTQADQLNSNIALLLNHLESKIFRGYFGSAHIYLSSRKGATTFSAHWDLPHNLIIQVRGKTRWNVFKEREPLRGKPRILQINQLTPDIDAVLNPGDMLYIPPRAYHCCQALESRISVSIPFLKTKSFKSRLGKPSVDRSSIRLEDYLD